MRRIVPFICAISLILPLGSPSQAGKGRSDKKVSRTETRDYASFAGVEAQGSSVSFCVNDAGCILLQPRKGEQYISVTLNDSSGTPAPFKVSFLGSETTYCGESGEIWLNNAPEVTVTVLGAATDCSGVGTTGTLVGTFSNVR